ncbi:MAG: hypothetical protein QM643_19180 [Shinella sp.]
MISLAMVLSSVAAAPLRVKPIANCNWLMDSETDFTMQAVFGETA